MTKQGIANKNMTITSKCINIVAAHILFEEEKKPKILNSN